jgi:hypothetical protein
MRASLRPGFGPSLPTLLRERLGIAPRTTLIVAAALALLAAVAAVGVVVASDERQLVHEDDPVFNLLYDGGRLKEVEPRGDELVRLEGRAGRAWTAVTVRPLRLPPYRGDVAKGLLPVHAELHLQGLRERDPGLVVRDEGRSTVNDSPGYQLAYTTGDRPRTLWREIFVVPDEEAPREGVVLAFQTRRPAKLAAAGTELVEAAKSAFRSFRFGTDRG